MTETPTRTLAPAEIEFQGEDWLVAEDLALRASELIDLYPDTLGCLADLNIAYLWRRKGGKSGGNLVYGKAVKRSGLVAAFTDADVVVWLAADNVAAAEYDEGQITALLHHELMHITVEYDEDGTRKVMLRGPDVALFVDEARLYGAWNTFLAETADAFKQQPLFS